MQRLKLLVLSFFPAFYPPTSGGEARLCGFYRALSAHHDIELISWTYSDRDAELIQHTPGFIERRIPKHEGFGRLHRRLDREADLGGDISGLVCALAAEKDGQMSDLIRERGRFCHAIIHESPYTVTADDDIGCHAAPRYYFSHNVEWRMLQSYYRGSWKDYYVGYVRRLEERLIRHARGVSFTGEEDRENLLTDFAVPAEKLFYLPNGIDCPEISAKIAQTKTALFMGSSHRPNVIAAEYIISSLAPEMKDWQFLIIGAVCRSFHAQTIPANVTLAGEVGEQTKSSMLQEAALALNPVTLGSGSNIKMLDYLAHYLPVLTTPFGARGLRLEDGKTAFIRELSDFLRTLREIGACAELARATLHKGKDKPQQNFAAGTLKAIGAAGRKHVEKRFSWPAIASRAGEYLLDSTARSERGKSRPALVVLNDYPVAGNRAGGARRILGLFSRLAYNYRVFILTLTPEAAGSERRPAPGVSEERFPWPASMREAAREEKSGREDDGIFTACPDDLLASRHAGEQKELIARLGELAPGAEALIFEHCYLAPLLAHCLRQKILPADLKIIHEAHNLERNLKAQLLKNHAHRVALIKEVCALEDLAVRLAGQTICVSEEEAHELRVLYPGHTVDVVENGAEIAAVRKEEALPAAPSEDDDFVCRDHAKRNNSTAQGDDPFKAVFIGSAHPPNVEALDFIVRELAPACPDILFIAAGACCHPFLGRRLPRNIQLLGEVDEEEKSALLKRAQAGLNPVFSGGGSSLKLAEYLASGLPAVSSRCGARGFALLPDYHLLVAAGEKAIDFKTELYILKQNPPLAGLIAANAGRWAEARLDWDHLARRYRLLLNPRRLLAVTYRCADPPRGGAETYLNRALQELHENHGYLIDIATTTADTITNRHHFEALFSKQSDYPGHPSFCSRLDRAETEPLDSAASLEKARALFALWNREGEKLTARLRFLWQDHVAPLLLSGWYPPENRGRGSARWTGPQAALFLPASVTAIKLDLSGSKLRYRWEQGGANAQKLERNRPLPVPPGGGVLHLEAQAQTPAQDPRILGAYVLGGQYRDNDQTWHDLDLNSDAERMLAATHLPLWIEALHKVSEERAGELEQAFLTLRGPRSRDLEARLEAALGRYDLVIAQGFPFSLPGSVTCGAKKAGVPVVCLPHLHPEDRFYHWASFYRAMSEADLTVLSPPQLPDLLAGPLKINARAIPGGMIDPDRYGDLAAAKNLFDRICPLEEPFFLVLGAKTGSKGYHRALDAFELARAEGVEAKTVLIGPDADGLPVGNRHIRYLGEQPADVVIGALASSAALVSMSESESFGMAIIESWACGRPVIVNRGLLAFRDLVDDQENGLLVGSAEELARAMTRVIRNPEEANAMGRKGRAKALAQFNRRTVGAQWAEALENLLPQARQL